MADESTEKVVPNGGGEAEERCGCTYPDAFTTRQYLFFEKRESAACVQTFPDEAPVFGYSNAAYQVPYGPAPDEERDALGNPVVPSFAMSFHKLLKHGNDGLLTPGAGEGLESFQALLDGLYSDATSSDFRQPRLNDIQRARPEEGRRVLINPQSSKSLAIQGGDPVAFQVDKILYPAAANSKELLFQEISLRSAASAAEMVEVYAMSLLRDVEFADYSTENPIIALAINALNEFPEFKGRPNGGPVTVASLFRGVNPGDLAGEYVSQFLLLPRPPLFPSGCAPAVASLINAGVFFEEFSRRLMVPKANRREFGVTFSEYLRLQNGEIPRPYVRQDLQGQTLIRSGRDLGSLVHIDGLYEEYLWAADILAGYDQPRSPVSPYRKFMNNPPLAANEGDGPTLGGADAAAMLGAVAGQAARAAWGQKWIVARRGRPEVFAALIETMPPGVTFDPRLTTTGATATAQLLSKVREYNARQGGDITAWGYSQSIAVNPTDATKLFLSQMYPEGSPAHPAWPSGHATIAGACVTVLKAIYDDHEPIRDPFSKTIPPQALLAPNGDPLRVGPELDKLASNVAFGRNFGGVHYRSDGEHGILLGEAVAIRFLMDQLRIYREKFRNLANNAPRDPYFRLVNRRGRQLEITPDAVTDLGPVVYEAKMFVEAPPFSAL
jgi:membrane-associated phospholipid phosphatase